MTGTPSIPVWHQPLVSIIVTHHDYSDHLADALHSVIDQTHKNWECVVVDDESSAPHLAKLIEIVEDLNCAKIQIKQLSKNAGQIAAFFAGLAHTSGEFVCALDPDDRYAPAFLQRALEAHLNDRVIAPIVSTDQYFVGPMGMIGAGFYRCSYWQWQRNGSGYAVPTDDPTPIFTPPTVDGWHISSTSALMMRRSALKYLRPTEPLPYKGQLDSYLATGLHWLGGTLFLPVPLIYRTLHANNAWMCENVFATMQAVKSDPKMERATRAEVTADVLRIMQSHDAPIVRQKPQARRGFFSRMRRSIGKRTDSLMDYLSAKHLAAEASDRQRAGI